MANYERPHLIYPTQKDYTQFPSPRSGTAQRNPATGRLMPGEVNQYGKPMGSTVNNLALSGPHDWGAFDRMFPTPPTSSVRTLGQNMDAIHGLKPGTWDNSTPDQRRAVINSGRDMSPDAVKDRLANDGTGTSVPTTGSQTLSSPSSPNAGAFDRKGNADGTVTYANTNPYGTMSITKGTPNTTSDRAGHAAPPGMGPDAEVAEHTTPGNNPGTTPPPVAAAAPVAAPQSAGTTVGKSVRGGLEKIGDAEIGAFQNSKNFVRDTVAGLRGDAVAPSVLDQQAAAAQEASQKAAFQQAVQDRDKLATKFGGVDQIPSVKIANADAGFAPATQTAGTPGSPAGTTATTPTSSSPTANKPEVTPPAPTSTTGNDSSAGNPPNAAAFPSPSPNPSNPSSGAAPAQPAASTDDDEDLKRKQAAMYPAPNSNATPTTALTGAGMTRLDKQSQGWT